MKNLLSITSIIIINLIGCNPEINTVDPQASSAITESKKNGFFIKAYKVDQVPKDFFSVKEAWVEYVWKNKLVNGKAVKTKTDGLQLNLILDVFRGTEIVNNRYLLDWEMKDEINGFFGKSSNVYFLFLKGTELPDSFNITIGKVKDNISTEKIGRFTVTPRYH
jgi:hypothetical protein